MKIWRWRSMYDQGLWMVPCLRLFLHELSPIVNYIVCFWWHWCFSVIQIWVPLLKQRSRIRSSAHKACVCLASGNSKTMFKKIPGSLLNRLVKNCTKTGLSNTVQKLMKSFSIIRSNVYLFHNKHIDAVAIFALRLMFVRRQWMCHIEEDFAKHCDRLIF